MDRVKEVSRYLSKSEQESLLNEMQESAQQIRELLREMDTGKGCPCSSLNQFAAFHKEV